MLSWTLTLRSETRWETATEPPDAASERRLAAEPRVERESLKPGDHLAGPTLVVEDQTVTVVPAGWSAQVDSHGNVLLRPRSD